MRNVKQIPQSILEPVSSCDYILFFWFRFASAPPTKYDSMMNNATILKNSYQAFDQNFENILFNWKAMMEDAHESFKFP